MRRRPGFILEAKMEDEQERGDAGVIRLERISKSFAAAEGRIKVVDDVTLDVQQGEIYGIIGFSGAGKSSLLRTINLLERPDSGAVIVDGEHLLELPKKELLRRRMAMGMIFQGFNLIGNRTVYENVSFPLEIAGVSKAERDAKIRHSLEVVGLLDKAKAYPAKLSGGQKQRVAIARTMATSPRILLCDEPTSALDPHTTDSILAFLKQLNREMGITIIIVTHEMEVVQSICDRVSVMENGRIIESFRVDGPEFLPQSPLARYLFRERVEPVAVTRPAPHTQGDGGQGARLANALEGKTAQVVQSAQTAQTAQATHKPQLRQGGVAVGKSD